MAPSQMKAIKVVSAGKAEIQEVPLPKLRDEYVLVKTTAVALNPTDWKHLDYLSQPGHTVGCDFVGTVEEIGKTANSNNAGGQTWKKGDRFAGVSHGVNNAEPEDGSFGEYVMAKGAVGMKVPGNVSDEEAATLGVGISTVGQGLYQSLKLPLPEGQKAGSGEWGLVYGGSTATGSLAIQFAKLSGCKVITTCSPRNFDLVKSLGAEEAFDYNDKDVSKKIRDYTSDSLTKVFDCISEGASPNISAEAISSSKGGVVTYLLPTKHDRADVENKMTLAYTIMGESFKFGPQPFEGKKEDLDFGSKFWEISRRLLEKGSVKVHPVQVEAGGLEGVFEGMKMLKEGKVSGKKLVYKI
ncbi:hypothetical protein LTR78_009479 [Recurvomyces mirabilis]|uniref:Enoyl reductase (ER) domain-containing protein n=1 Tax=Recurvomyces mirabilis TaxID=574656 RepID=A0AAE0WGI8_9PEZI|nr:hypothetical protein LTR78_009479 [Recurvomyces mirabilis]KAK5152384.1 hypothetical protein LTS14_008331 [Recurvomyces mirabilis]